MRTHYLKELFFLDNSTMRRVFPKTPQDVRNCDELEGMWFVDDECCDGDAIEMDESTHHSLHQLVHCRNPLSWKPVKEMEREIADDQIRPGRKPLRGKTRAERKEFWRQYRRDHLRQVRLAQRQEREKTRTDPDN